jgi:hypothetical protein
MINQKTLEHKLSKNENRGFKSFLFKNDSVYLGIRTGIIKSKFEDFDINKLPPSKKVALGLAP